MNKSEVIRMAFSALGANKLRSSLTILGITIGVFSVVSVMTALSAVRQSIDTSLSIFAPNVFEISRYPAIQFDGGDRSWRRRPPVTPGEARQFVREMEYEGISVTQYAVDGGERVRYRDRKTSPTMKIFGANPNFLLTHRYEIAYGRNLSFADMEFDRPVIVLGHEVVEAIFPDENPIGKIVIADDNKYEVIGVLKERGQLFGNTLDNINLIPITRFVANNWNWRRSVDLSVVAPSPLEMSATEDLATGIFRRVRGLEPGEENNFEIFSNDSMKEAFSKIALVVGTGGLLISAIALLCAGIGIMNIMLVSVTERTREIGLRKSIGARQKDILLQFLLEAVLLSLLGGGIGILLGGVVGNLVARQLEVSMIIPWLWIQVAIGVCAGIGITFGFFPALRAARLHPIEALRFE